MKWRQTIEFNDRARSRRHNAVRSGTRRKTRHHYQVHPWWTWQWTGKGSLVLLTRVSTDRAAERTESSTVRGVATAAGFCYRVDTHTSTRIAEDWHLQVQRSRKRLSIVIICWTGWRQRGRSYRRWVNASLICSIEHGRTCEGLILRPRATRPIRIWFVRGLEIPAQANIWTAASWVQGSLWTPENQAR